MERDATLTTLDGASCFAHSVLLCPNAIYVITASSHLKVQMWNADSGVTCGTWTVNFERKGFVFSSDSHFIAMTSRCNILLLPAGVLTTCITLKGHNKRINQVAYLAGNELLASALREGAIIVWDIESSALMWTLDGDTDWVNSLCFLAHGRLLASASQDTTVKG